MGPTFTSLSDREQRFQEVVADYLEGLEAGRAGDLPALLLRHPDLAEEITAFFAHQEQVAHLARPLRTLVGEVAAISPAPGGSLGDFRLVREVGRGGMGVVYEAEQISLRRRVALKVLPLAATMDPRQLQRFHNEAQAAACLHHTNIVPVFAVGCERGVHFYAMQFIDGRPLSDVIREMGQPPTVPAPAEPVAGEPTTAYAPADGAGETTEPAPRLSTLTTGAGGRGREYFRRLAELGKQAAEALDHAHQAGIVHRDIKPANLLLDVTGRLWVTDFGLAHVQHGEASLTMTGDLVGTVRYMSPEQALAKRVLIDHRTDVYSLGATLYELLTLRPAFKGSDRQELLRQIAFEEPRPPRHLNKAIPAELETIVLKAMEKNPADRYITAQELADDLRRWLEDRAIRARRPSLVQRARKWCRRHRPVAASLAAALLAAVVLAVALGFWYQRRLAETDREVTAALSQSRTLLDEGDKQIDQPQRWQETVRVAQAKLEQAEKLLAAGVATAELTAQVRQVREAVEAAVADSRLLVEIDRTRLEQVVLGNVSQGPVLHDLARIQRVGVVTYLTAENHWALARRYAELLGNYGLDLSAPEAAAARVWDSRLREELLSALADWERLVFRTKEQQRVAKVYELALPPDSLQGRLLAAISRKDSTALAKLVQDPALLDLPPPTLFVLSRKLDGTGELAVAEQLLLAGLERKPGDFWLNFELGKLLSSASRRQTENAVGYLTVALALRPEPDVYFYLGLVLRVKGDVEGAIHCCRAALRINPKYDAARLRLADNLCDQGRLDEAITEYRETIRSAPVQDAIRSGSVPKAALAYLGLGSVLQTKGRLNEAIAAYREAIGIQKDNPEAHCILGHALRDQGEFRQALEAVCRGHELGSKESWYMWPYPSGQWVWDCERLVELDGKLPLS
jgi:serine/threonine protein kinase/tetratricopeptide (TPR) repeat protein